MSSMPTCICCKVVFSDGETQRSHYKSEWHRYNLKRRTVDLPPLLELDFIKLEAQHRPAPEEPVTPHYCPPCGKSFGNEAQFNNHIRGKKHLELEKQFQKKKVNGPKEMNTVMTPAPQKMDLMVDENEADDDCDWESIGSDGEEDESSISQDTCLFCSHISKDSTENLKHMSVSHSFFIPDIEYLVDANGLLDYLGAKVGSGHRCLWCGEKGKSFKTCQSVQKHMIDKGHCKLFMESDDSLVEYSDFYDYSSSYPLDDQESKDESVPDAELDVNHLLELVLPSGAKVGHRSLAIYFKQNLRDKPEHPVEGNKNSRSHNRELMSQYQTLGWRGSNTPALILRQKARDQQYLAKRRMKLGVKANKLQTHFRSQILM